jgi:phage terminase small subunit
MSIDLVHELAKDNPAARLIDLQLFAGALLTYKEASKNIEANGAIVMHPRTGAPIDNPYLKIVERSGRTLSKMRIKSDRVVRLLDAEAKP